MRNGPFFAALCAVAAAFSTAYAADDAGEAGAFLRQEVEARGAALAGALGGLAEGPAALRWNPAALAHMRKPEVSASHILLFEDTDYDFVAFGAGTRLGGLAASYQSQGSDGFEARSTPFDAPTSFSISQSAFLAGWGFAPELPGLGRPLAVGVAAKSVREKIYSASASGTGADAGLLWRSGRGWSVGLLAQNVLAPEITFVRAPVRYARAYELSPAYRRDLGGGLKAAAALRLSKIERRGLKASGGVELSYRDLADLRVGMASKGLATGVGLRWGNTGFDYAVLMADLGLSHILSLTQRFGQTPEELEAAIRRGISKLSRSEAERLARTYRRAAKLKEDEGRLTDAIRDLEAAALWDPREPAIPRELARLRELLERTLKERMLATAAELGRRELAEGRLTSSRQYWLSVLEQDPGNAEAQEALKRIERMLSQEQRRELQALQERERALAAENLRRRRQAAAERLKQAGKLAARRRWTEALTLAEAVLREAPDSAEARRLAEECRQALQKPLSDEDRRKVERLYYRAVESYLQGDFAKAGALADEALSIDPASESGRKLKEKVEAARGIGR